jgi:hypothetical protein
VKKELAGHDPGCLGRDMYVQVGGRDLGGYWRQDEGDEPTFDAEWDLRFASLDVGTLLSLYKLFIGMRWEDVDSIDNMLGTAIDTHEGGDAWRDTLRVGAR